MEGEPIINLETKWEPFIEDRLILNSTFEL